MSDRVGSFICPHCGRVFQQAHSCQRHLSRSHVGLPQSFPFTVLLHCKEGPGVGTGAPSSDAAGFNVAAAAVAGDSNLPPNDEVAGGASAGVPQLSVVPAVLSATGNGIADASASVCSRVRALYRTFRDAEDSVTMYEHNGSMPSQFKTPFLRSILRNASLCN